LFGFDDGEKTKVIVVFVDETGQITRTQNGYIQGVVEGDIQTGLTDVDGLFDQANVDIKTEMEVVSNTMSELFMELADQQEALEEYVLPFPYFLCLQSERVEYLCCHSCPRLNEVERRNSRCVGTVY